MVAAGERLVFPAAEHTPRPERPAQDPLVHQMGSEAPAGADNVALLRESGLVVTIEHDLDPHLDRAIELINGTAHLNDIAPHLPENIENARAELRRMLAGHAVHAGILRVRDRHGDHGYCGLYIMHSGNTASKLRYFCFSARIADMGVEAWLYRRLGRPVLNVRADKMPAFVHDAREIDWVSLELPESAPRAGTDTHVPHYVYIRGTSDLRAVGHYFNLVAGAMYGDFNSVEDGVALPLHHSTLARHALMGLPPMAAQLFGQLGYQSRHFQSAVSQLPERGRAIWLLNFWGDPAYALYRHNGSGRTIPVVLPNFHRHLMDLTQLDPAKTGIGSDILRILKNRFTFAGMIGADEFKENVRLILQHATPETRVFILLSGESTSANSAGKVKNKAMVNGWLTELAGELPIISLLNIGDFVAPGEETSSPNQIDRKVYFRIYQEIMRRLQFDTQQAAAE